MLTEEVKPDSTAKDNGNGHKALCPTCKVEGVYKAGISQGEKHNGRAYKTMVCPQCGEFIPGHFRWKG